MSEDLIASTIIALLIYMCGYSRKLKADSG